MTTMQLATEVADVAWQYSRLFTSRVYHGIRVPRASRQVVLLIPGFLAPDVSLVTMYDWLWRCGFRPVFADILANVDCPQTTYHAMAERLRTLQQTHPGPAWVIGHSLGGTVALGLTISHPELVRHGIALGSPLQEVSGAIPVDSAVAALYRALEGVRTRRGQGHAECSRMTCWCPFRQSITTMSPGPARFTSIYTPADPVVDWRASARPDVGTIQLAAGGHLSLIANPDVYSAIWSILSAPPP